MSMEKKETEKTEEISDLEFQEILEALKAIMGKTPSEAIAEAIKDLSKDEKISYFTDVEKREVAYMALKKTIANRYHIAWLSDHIDNELKLRVSIKRQGRKELVRVVAGVKKSLEDRAKGLLQRKKEDED